MRRLLLLTPLAFLASGWDILGEAGRPTGDSVEPEDVLEPIEVDWSHLSVPTDPQQLAAVASTTARYLRDHAASGEPAPSGMLSAVGVDPAHVLRTLEFLADVAREDAGASHQRLQDPDWLDAHLRVYRWRSDEQSARRHGVALSDGKIRVTRYLVDQTRGSSTRTDVYDTALYAVPSDEAHLSNSAAERFTGIRHRYTRRQVLDGVYLPGAEAEGQAEPLVWLTREAVHEALLQGTIEVTLEDGTTRTFNVHRNNGIAYRRGVTSEGQDRLWYFREVQGAQGWGTASKITLAPMVSVAGDAYNLGLGSVFALVDGHDRLRLVVLSDTGGAFQPNLYQLDLFTGAWPSRDAFAEGTRDLPRRAEAYLVVLRDS